MCVHVCHAVIWQSTHDCFIYFIAQIQDHASVLSRIYSMFFARQITIFRSQSDCGSIVSDVIFLDFPIEDRRDAWWKANIFWNCSQLRVVLRDRVRFRWCVLLFKSNYVIGIFTHLKLCLTDAIHNFKWGDNYPDLTKYRSTDFENLVDWCHVWSLTCLKAGIYCGNKKMKKRIIKSFEGLTPTLCTILPPNMIHSPNAGQCWPTVYDVGPALNQHWVNISRLLVARSLLSGLVTLKIQHQYIINCVFNQIHRYINLTLSPLSDYRRT